MGPLQQMYDGPEGAARRASQGNALHSMLLPWIIRRWISHWLSDWYSFVPWERFRRSEKYPPHHFQQCDLMRERSYGRYALPRGSGATTREYGRVTFPRFVDQVTGACNLFAPINETIMRIDAILRGGICFER